MSQTLTVNGVAFTFPSKGESPNSSPAVDWGVTVTQWAAAVTAGMLQKAGGAFTLTAEIDFGASFGLKSAYYKSRATTPASAGQVRLGYAEELRWRKQDDTGDLALTVNAANQLLFNGSVVALGTGDVSGPGSSTDNAFARFDGTTGKVIQNSSATLSDAGVATLVGALISGLTASRVVQTDGSKNLESSLVTTTELGHVSGVTSAIQTQINAKAAGAASSTDNAVARFDSTTGKVLQNSGVIVDDSNNVTGINDLTFAGSLIGPSPTTASGNFTGPFGSSQAGTLEFVKYGRAVTCFFPRIIALANASGTDTIAFSGTIPAAMRPKGPSTAIGGDSTGNWSLKGIRLTSGSSTADESGTLRIGTSGVLELAKDDGNFSTNTSLNNGFAPFSVSWLSDS